MNEYKRMAKPFIMAALILAAACNRPEPAPPAAMAKPVSLAEKSDLLNFAYAWPGEAATIPALDSRLRAEAEARRAEAIAMAQEDRKARPADAPFFAHEFRKTWTVEGEAAGLLALRGEFSTYTGGAHGMSGFDAILWGRAAGRDMPVWDLFADPAGARTALKAAFCPALDKAREAKRGAPVKPDGDSWDTGCPDIEKQVVIPSDPRDGRFTAFRVLIAPYEAGPYAEGSYDVPLPLDPALAALVKPEWQAAFAAR